MAVTRYDQVLYDDPASIYEQLWLEYTEENDQLNSLSNLIIQASLSKTEENDLLDSFATTRKFAFLEYTEEDDYLNSNSQIILQAQLNILEDQDILNSSTNLIIQSFTNYIEDEDILRSVIWKLPFSRELRPQGTGPYSLSSDGFSLPYESSVGSYVKPYKE